MLPNLESLRCFEAAARCLSFRTAARRVALSPAAFSDRIRRLEEELGVSLFDRTTRRVALTPAGVRLLPQAQRCLTEAERCREVAGDTEVRAPYALRIGTRFELGLSWLVPALGGLRLAHPERTLHVAFGDSDDLLGRLYRGEIDAAITSARVTRPGLDSASLHPESYAFVGARERLVGEPLRGAADAPRHTLLDTMPDLPLFRYFRDARPAQEMWAFQALEFLGTIAAIRHRVLEGAGVAVLPRSLIEGDLHRDALVELLPETRMAEDRFRLLWLQGNPQSEPLRVLAGELLEVPLRSQVPGQGQM